jgi:acetyltransferase-like isoleucine patch superfamily enzyme
VTSATPQVTTPDPAALAGQPAEAVATRPANRLGRRVMYWYQRCRILKFRFFSDCARIEGHPTIRQPVQFVGKGTIRFKGTANLGWYPAPYFLSGYIYLEARSESSIVEIGDAVVMSNCTSIVSDGPGIFIGRKTMLGTYCEIVDSDFHDLHPDRRTDGVAKTGKVVIGENVLIGSNVKILKGVKIGDNAIIANGSVVTRSVPPNAVVFGNPARAGMGLLPE